MVPGYVQGAPRPPRGRWERGIVFRMLMVNAVKHLTSNIEWPGQATQSQTKASAQGRSLCCHGSLRLQGWSALGLAGRVVGQILSF